MVNSLLKSSLREIRQSLGRYLAIMAIIGLGVGFFAGLRMSQPNMNATGVEYLNEYNMHDFRLLSTLGFTDSDVEAFKQHHGIESAHGAVYSEFLWQSSEDAETVLIAHSITEDINEPHLLAGRMAVAGNECVADATLFSEDDIGTKIEISKQNDEETRDLFLHDAYTIVGIAKSPYYLNYERGTSSIGAGNIAGFIYIPESGFSFEAYYELYLTLSEHENAYSPEYDAQVEELEPELDALLDERAQIRYDGIYQDAYKEILEGEQEVQDGWDEFHAEKQKTQRKLNSSYSMLSNGEAEYADGQKAYEQGLVEYENGLKEYEAGVGPLEEAEAQVAEARKTFDTEKAAAMQKLDVASLTLKAAQAEYDRQLQKYESGMQTIESNRARIPAMEQEIADRSGYIAKQAVVVNTARLKMLATLPTDPNYDAVRQVYEQEKQAYDSAVAQNAKDRAEVGRMRAENVSLQASLPPLKRILDASKPALDAGWAEFNQQKAAAEEQLNAAEAPLLEAEAEVAANRKLLDEAKAQLDAAKAELDATPGRLAAARAELDNGWSQYRYGKARANSEFAKAEQELKDAEAELADGKSKLDELEKPTTFLLTRDENVGYVCFDNDISIVKSISVVFPVFFFLVAALVCMTTMTRMVDEQRTQIGVLKAMGYSDGQIMGKYMFYSGSAAVIGSIIGYLLGSYTMPKIIWEIYGIMYGFAELKFTFDPMLALVSFASAILCSVGATYFSCRHELKQPAAELIRPKAPKAGKRVFLEYITPIWSRLSFLYKVSVRNVLRYRSRLVMMVLGIGGCAALLVTGFGIRDSIMTIADDQYDTITLYDYAVSFMEELSPEEADAYLRDAGYTSDYGVLVHNGGIDVVTEEKTKSVNFIVPHDGSLEGFMDFHQGDEPVVFPGKDEVIIDEGLAKVMNLQVGDSLTLRDKNLGTMDLTISGIYDNFFHHNVYISPETYEDHFGVAPEYAGMFVHARNAEDPYAESVALLEDENVSNVMVTQSMRDRVTDMLSRLDLVVVIVVVCAGALAFIVLYNLTNINITERVREIATIKVLGFDRNEVATYVFREIRFLAILGSVFGLLMGKLLHLFVMAQIQVEGMFFPAKVAPMSYLIAMVLTIVFAVVITMLMRPKLDHIDMAESLKSIE